jgi:centrin-1
MDAFSSKVHSDINELRTNPTSMIKRFEVARTGASRFKGKGSSDFINEINKVLDMLSTIKPISNIQLNKALQKVAENTLQEFVTAGKFDNSDSGIRKLTEGIAEGYGPIYIIKDEGADTPDDVINKIMLDKKDTKRVNRKYLQGGDIKAIGIANQKHNNENITIIVLADKAEEFKVKTAPKKLRTDDDLDEIKQAFDWYDIHQIGKIDPKETMAAMRSLGYHIKNPTMFEIISSLDTIENHNAGGVDFDTFVDHVLGKISDTQTKDGLLRIFNLFIDDYRDNTISLGSLKKILHEMNYKYRESELKEMVEKSNPSYELTFEEFYDFMVRNYGVGSK